VGSEFCCCCLIVVPVVAPSDVGGGGGTSRELTITWTVGLDPPPGPGLMLKLTDETRRHYLTSRAHFKSECIPLKIIITLGALSLHEGNMPRNRHHKNDKRLRRNNTSVSVRCWFANVGRKKMVHHTLIAPVVFIST